MDAFKLFIMLVMSVLLVMSVSALDPDMTEKLLTGLENSEVNLFATTSHWVSHMETDKYKPGYVMYTDEHTLKTSDGNITQTIAGHSCLSGYKEAVGEDARIGYIFGFTQISPTQVIVLEFYDHCLRLVDRVSRVTSVFAGQCQSNGYQDGSSAKFYYPIAVIVDKRNSKQLLVADVRNIAVRTVEIESKNVGTFIKSNQLAGSMSDLVQDKITGDIYITNYKSLYKLSYNTKSLNMISYGITGEINGKQPSYLWGLFMIETVILVADRNNDRIIKYDTAHDTWSTLNICDVIKTRKNTDQCVTESPRSILLTSNRLLIGGDNKITSYKPVCNSQNKTVYTDPHTGTARVELTKGNSIELSEGNYTYETPGPSNEICVTALIVTENLTEALTTSLPPTTTPCTDNNITVYTDTHTGTARVELVGGLSYIYLPEGIHAYETLTAQNATCITSYHVIDNSTSATTGLIASITVAVGIFLIVTGVLGFVVNKLYRREKCLSQDASSPVYTSLQPTSTIGSGNQVDEHTYNCLELNDLSDNLEHKEQIKSRQPSYVEFLETVPGRREQL